MAEYAESQFQAAGSTDTGTTLRSVLLLVGAVHMVADLALIFLWVPTEQVMGVIQRIFYFHVPGAWVGLLAPFVVFCASILYLWKGQRRWDALAHSAGEISVLFISLHTHQRRHLGKDGLGRLVDVGATAHHDPDPVVDVRGLPYATVLRTDAISGGPLLCHHGNHRLYRRAHRLLLRELVARYPPQGDWCWGRTGKPGQRHEARPYVLYADLYGAVRLPAVGASGPEK